MIDGIRSKTLPPRLGGKVTVIAEGKVNPGEVSRDGSALVFGEFVPTSGECVFRWKDGDITKLNTDGYSSYQANCNKDASVVVYHRYSLADASDDKGNWDIARWENGTIEVIANTDKHEMSPDVDDSGKTIVYDRSIKRGQVNIMRWQDGKTEEITTGENVDLFPETSGNGQRIVWRRDLETIWIRDNQGQNKPINNIKGESPAGVMLDQKGEKILYTSKDEHGDEDIFLTDISKNTTVAVSAIKGMDEYEGYLSGDGKSVVFTGIDRRKEKPDMNVYLWNEGQTKQLSFSDGGLNTKATISDDGKAISWYWIDREDTNHRKVLLWQKDEPKAV